MIILALILALIAIGAIWYYCRLRSTESTVERDYSPKKQSETVVERPELSQSSVSTGTQTQIGLAPEEPLAVALDSYPKQETKQTLEASADSVEASSDPAAQRAMADFISHRQRQAQSLAQRSAPEQASTRDKRAEELERQKAFAEHRRTQAALYRKPDTLKHQISTPVSPVQPQSIQTRLGQMRPQTATPSKSKDAVEIAQHLANNQITYFYHFTSRKNLALIKQRGGLYSWRHLERQSWSIPVAGGDSLSRQLDSKYGLDDYVRLSFCEDHPMSFRLRQKGEDIVLLLISPKVAQLSGVLFSDRNAADKSHKRDGGMIGLRLVDIAATKRRYLSKTDPDFGPHQAEVMVPRHVDLKYILNIDNPIEL